MQRTDASYRQDRLTPRVRFDEVETTISHLFRRPHPALRGRSYGQALGEALVARGFALSRWVELGGGGGFVGKEWAALAPSGKATFLDLSRPLLQVQRQQVPRAAAVRADARRLPFRDGALTGTFLANEVVADLPVAKAADCGDRVGRYGLAADPNAWLNLGAMQLLEELWRVMGTGARACLTEFGGDFQASAVRLQGPAGAGAHHEYSIHFGQLERVAAALGFQVERVLLADLLGVDRSMRVASYPDLMRLRRLVPSLPVLAVPEAELRRRHPVLTTLCSFDFPQIGSPRFPDPKSQGGFCQLFFALLLKK